ncbi:MAG: tRNA (guanosine(46)-N7)-methyltransferase TrmB [Gammaproteobacteria bacterium]|nr:tRNA (guanosine(46)-N7)-methyltransferase TrmB [Gammaproteobacteria bacterium]MDE2345518.1 tRNA (guanosine(46)-N7)-methyltransferase TrmB [Gammaproteobacteria bacterium]
MRKIRSFVRREGRLTNAQRRALQSLLPSFGLETVSTPWNFCKIFGREAPRVLEIGFGNGENLLALAQAHPEQDFIGIEVHRPGVGHLLNRLAAAQVSNVRLACEDAREVLERCVPDCSLDAILLYFPDPWPKKRHHKRRLVQADFVGLLARKLKGGGVFRVATDWPDYAQHIARLMSARPEFMAKPPTDSDPDTVGRSPTRFERRGLHLGHKVSELCYRRR